MDKFTFQDTYVSNLFHSITPKMRSVFLIWIVCSIFLCVMKPNWKILKDENNTHSFSRILFASMIFTVLAIIWNFIRKFL